MNRTLLAFAILAIFFVCRQSTHAQDLPFQDKILPALFNPKVQKELDLSEKQKTRLREMLEKIKKTQRELGGRLKEFTETGASKEAIEDKRNELIAEIEEVKSDVQGDALEVLLPHQIDRLKQVTIQVMMRETAKKSQRHSGLLTEEMMAFLEIDEKQAQKLKDKSLELQKKLMEEFKELQDKYSKELLKELTAKQRKKYQEAVGNFFVR